MFPYWFTGVAVDVIGREITAAGNCRESPECSQIPWSTVCVYKSEYEITVIIQISLYGNHGYLTFLVVVTTLSLDICHRAKFGPQLSM